MKIIINQPRSSYFVGGAEMISFNHAINFLEQGHEVYYFTILPSSIGLKYSSQFKAFYKKYHNKINIIEIKQDESDKYIYKIQPGEDRCRWNIESIFYNQKMYEYISEHGVRYDVVFSYYILDAVFVPRELVQKNVLYLCGTPKQQNDFQGSFLSAYDFVIAISQNVKTSWKKYYNKNMSVISTGIDCDKFALKIFPIKETEYITVLYVGRLISRKNVDKIIYAFEKLYKKYRLRLLIVGDGPDREHLESISRHVEFIGTVANTETFYKQSDIFVSPSEYGEGLQGSVLEAMSCGLTVVATKTQINMQLLTDGRGFVVAPTVESVIAGIEEAIKADRKEIAKKCRNYVVENYDWKNKVNEIWEVIK